MRFSGPEILLVLLLVLLLFGAKRLPDLAKSIGKAFKTFKREIRGVEKDLDLTDERDDQDDTPG